MLERLLDDVRHGSRILTKAPGLSATAALLIGLVVGGNATVYSMVNGVVRGPAPGVAATNLVSFGAIGRPGIPYHPAQDYRVYAAQTRTLRALAAFGFSREAVGTPNGSFLLDTIPVTANYFDTIGVAAAIGRTFTTADDRAGAEAVAVISDASWRGHFGGRGDIIGQRITISGEPMTVIGVAAPDFAGTVVLGERSDVWVPFRGSVDGDRMMIGQLARRGNAGPDRAEFDDAADTRAGDVAERPAGAAADHRIRGDGRWDTACVPARDHGHLLDRHAADAGGRLRQRGQPDALAGTRTPAGHRCSSVTRGVAPAPRETDRGGGPGDCRCRLCRGADRRLLGLGARADAVAKRRRQFDGAGQLRAGLAGRRLRARLDAHRHAVLQPRARPAHLAARIHCRP